MKNRYLLGIDIGSGVKGGVVDLEIELTPSGSASTRGPPRRQHGLVVKQIVDHFADQVIDLRRYHNPTVVLHGVTASAASIDQSWVNAANLLGHSDARRRQRRGRRRPRGGALVQQAPRDGDRHDARHRHRLRARLPGLLVPNTELSIEIDGHDAETRAAASVKKREELSYEEYIPRLQRYYETLEFLFSPDLFVVGGGISKESENFLPFLKLRAPIIPAKLRNAAGIVGAAAYAADWLKDTQAADEEQ